MSKKTLFTSHAENVLRRKSFQIPESLVKRIELLEERAMKRGFQFPLNRYVQDAIEKLVSRAESELDLQESKSPETLPNYRSPTA